MPRLTLFAELEYVTHHSKYLMKPLLLPPNHTNLSFIYLCHQTSPHVPITQNISIATTTYSTHPNYLTTSPFQYSYFFIVTERTTDQEQRLMLRSLAKSFLISYLAPHSSSFSSFSRPFKKLSTSALRENP